MPVHHAQQLVARPVVGQAVRRRVVAVEPVPPVRVGAELAPQVVGRLVLRVLEVVAAVGRRLPDIEDGVRDSPARGEVGDGAVHPAHAAAGRRVLDDGVAELAEGGVRGPKGAGDGGGRRVDAAVRDDFVGDFVDESVA